MNAGRYAVAHGAPSPEDVAPVPAVPVPGLPRRQVIELPNGAVIVCFRCFLPIGVSGDGSKWVHAYSGSEFCNGTGDFTPGCHCPPIRCSPYLYPLVEEFLVNVLFARASGTR